MFQPEEYRQASYQEGRGVLGAEVGRVRNKVRVFLHFNDAVATFTEVEKKNSFLL